MRWSTRVLVRIAPLGLAAVASLSTACNTPECGPGTKQVQQKDGSLRCLPVDAPASSIVCNADLGAIIVGGECISRITCGAGTTYDPTTGQCVGGGGPVRGQPPPCPAPSAGNICVNGVIKHFLDNTNLAVGETRRIALFEPLSFLTSPSPTPLTTGDGNPAVADTDDGFVFANVKTPASNLIALAVYDPSVDVAGIPAAHKTGVGGQVFAGQAYRIDAFTSDKSMVTAWSGQSGGIDYATQGAYVLRYFAEPVPRPTEYVQDNVLATSGVTVLKGAATPAETRYFGANLSTIDPAQTATTATGAAILPALGLVANYSGSGGTFNSMPIKWNTIPGGTTANVVFVAKFNRCLNDACTFQEQ